MEVESVTMTLSKRDLRVILLWFWAAENVAEPDEEDINLVARLQNLVLGE